jgi:hypothetical protein
LKYKTTILKHYNISEFFSIKKAPWGLIRRIVFADTSGTRTVAAAAPNFVPRADNFDLSLPVCLYALLAEILSLVFFAKSLLTAGRTLVLSVF